MISPALNTRNALGNFHKLVSGVGVTDGVLPQTAPAVVTNRAVAQGKIPESGCLTVGSSLAATISIRLWNSAAKSWWIPGSGSGDSAKVFASDKMFDYFYGPPGAPYYLFSSVGSNAVWDNGDEFNHSQPY